MDMMKIGKNLQELRKEKGMTQEQLAEHFNVARRTVSRWETGSNMPDLDLLMEISDLYQVDLREMLNGERKSEVIMNKEMEETVLQVAEYSNAGKERITKFVRIIFIVGILALIANMWMEVTELPETFWFGFLKGGTVGLAIGAMGFGILYTTGAMKRIADFKMRMLGKSRQAQD
jgi:transcriptional regulator with XRE-family HTH domain